MSASTGSQAQLPSSATGSAEPSVVPVLAGTSSDRVAGISRPPRRGFETPLGVPPAIPLTQNTSVPQVVPFLVDDFDTRMSKGMKGTLIGAGVGGIAGVGVTLATSMDNEFWPVVMIQNVGAGALIGALVGAIISRL
jgi:hypothetical protein